VCATKLLSPHLAHSSLTVVVQMSRNFCGAQNLAHSLSPIETCESDGTATTTPVVSVLTVTGANSSQSAIINQDGTRATKSYAHALPIST